MLMNSDVVKSESACVSLVSLDFSFPFVILGGETQFLSLCGDREEPNQTNQALLGSLVSNDANSSYWLAAMIC